jgi:CBS domain-containing protein
MKHKPRITDVMTSDPETVHIGQSLADVYTVLQNGTFHHVPVVDGRKPVGMISATDILALVYDIDKNDDRMLRSMLEHQFTLDDAVSTDLITVQRDETLRAVADHLSHGSRHSVVVVNDEGDLDGIITSSDLIREFGALL